MNNPNTIQEILLVTDSRFVLRQFCNNGINGSTTSGNVADKLEEACWKGTVSGILHGIPAGSTNKDELSLWQTYVSNSFLMILLSNEPACMDYIHSINPCCVLMDNRMN